MSKDMTEKNGDDNLKIFTMRNIPEELRKRWKIVCTIESITMEQFAVEAIREKVERYSQSKLSNIAANEATTTVGAAAAAAIPTSPNINTQVAENVSK